MRIVHLDTGRTWRGGQAQVLHLVRGLAARGHTSLLLAPRGPLLDAALQAGIAAEAWGSAGEWDRLAMVAATRALRAFAPDVAHAHSAHAHATGVPAARLARVPAVVVSRRVDFAVGRHALSRAKYRMPVDRYLCISRGVMDVMRASGVPGERLALVPSGVPEPAPDEAAHVADLRATLGIPSGAPVVGTVAALAPHKDHATLLAAAAGVLRTHPDVHFVWLGDGECRPALERERARLGLEHRVHMPGFRADARALMPQLTLFVMSSWLEGLGTSILDAAMRGVPIVATATGGIPEIIEDGVSGWLVATRDPQALAVAIVEALDDPERRVRRAGVARARARAWSVDAMVERTIAVYGEVLAAPRGTGVTTR